MNIDLLDIATKVLLSTGDKAEVKEINAQEYSVLIRYLDALGDPALVGTQDWVSADDIISIDGEGHIEGET